MRFNDIVSVAREFYPDNPEAGVKELVGACDRLGPVFFKLIGPLQPNPLYVKGVPMWRVLQEDYVWMLSQAEGEPDT